MKILLVSHTADLNGSELSLLDLAIGLRKSNLDCMVLCPEYGPLVERLAAEGIAFSIKKLYRPQRNPYKLIQFCLFWIPLVISLSIWMRQNNFSIIYNNTIDGLYAPFSARLVSIPCLWHVHEVKPLQPRLRLFFIWLLKILPVQVIFNSLATMQAFNMVSYKSCQVVHNGITVDKKQKNHFHDADTVIVGFIGQMVSIKRPDLFLKIFANTQQKIPSLRAIMAGDGILLNEIKQLVYNLNLNDKVDFMGYVESVDDFFMRIDILVLTSEHEAFGRVLIEAMCRKIPVVAASVGGVPEVVQDGTTGFLVPKDDVEVYVDKVVKLAIDHDLRQRMGCAGRKHVLANFTIDKYCEQLIALLTQYSK